MKMFYKMLFFFFLAIIIEMNAKPKLVFEGGNTYDWGIVKPGDSPLKANIKVYNKSKDTIVIKRVKPMCGCTTAPLSKKILAPKDSATLKVTFNVKHYQGDVLKKITVHYKHKRDSKTTLNLKAHVFRPIKLFPAKYLNIGQMFLGTETIGKIVINNLAEHNILVTGVELRGEGLQVNIKEGDIIPSNGDFVLEANITPKTLGPYTCKIKISTNDPDIQLIEISGWGKVDPAANKSIDHSNIEIDTVGTVVNKKSKPVVLSPNAKKNKNLIAPPVLINPNLPINSKPKLQMQANPKIQTQANPNRQIKIDPKIQPIPLEPPENKSSKTNKLKKEKTKKKK